MALKTLTRQDRLTRLAMLLRAERSPYYVTHPLPSQLRRDFPCEGWYWIPPGCDRPELLGRDSYDAYHQLLTQIEALDQEPDDSVSEPDEVLDVV